MLCKHGKSYIDKVGTCHMCVVKNMSQMVLA